MSTLNPAISIVNTFVDDSSNEKLSVHLYDGQVSVTIEIGAQKRVTFFGECPEMEEWLFLAYSLVKRHNTRFPVEESTNTTEGA